MSEQSQVGRAMAPLPTRIISFAWGEPYLNELLTFALPALLAPGNLPSLASRVECEFVLVTEERFFARVAAHPAIAKVQALCPVRLTGLDDLVTRSDQYGIALTYALHRALADLGPAVTDHWLIFFNADFILADGSLRNVVDQLMAGERIVAAPSYCTIKEAVIPQLKQRLAFDPTVLAMPSREMARLILQHRHSTIQGKTINRSAFHMCYMDQFYWSVDDNTLLGHQMPVAIVGMRPERYVAEPNSYWDHGLIREFCPDAEVKLLGDSDDFLMLELRSGTVAQDQIVSGPPDPAEIGSRMISWVTPYQASFAQQPLTLHAAALPPSIDESRQQLAGFVANVLSYAPNFPSHLDHPQWDYHWPNFVKSRHALFSTKFGSITSDMPPPPSMLTIDQLWWRLDGLGRSDTQRIKILADAIEQIDRQFEATVTSELSAMKLSPGQAIAAPYANAKLTLKGESTDDRVLFSSASEISSVLDMIEERRSLKSKEAIRQKVLLQHTIAAVEKDRRNPEGEYDKLKREYERSIQPRVKTAAIPVVQWWAGNDLAAVRHEGKLRRFARSVYGSLFGRWPYVTHLSPLWTTVQPLIRAIDEAKADGAQDVLLVGDDPRIREAGSRFTGKHAWVSIAGMLSGLFGKASLPGQRFDLCILALSTADLSHFAEIVHEVSPCIVPGGTLIVFHVDGGRPLNDVPPISGSMEFGGSTLSVYALRIRSATLSYAAGWRPSHFAQLLGAIALSTPLALIANVIDPALRRTRPVPARSRTSLTATIPIPMFENDDGSFEHAVAAGVYIAGVEAPIVPENRVDAATANPPGTAVILTFGQSNAANEGAARYAARHNVHVFNIFDMNYYKAADPLPGASGPGGSVWGRLGDKLIASGRFKSILFVPIAFGGSFIEDWTPLSGNCYRRLQFALSRLRRAGISIDMLFWHQGEADANHTMISADEYATRFRLLARRIRRAGVTAPIYVAKASLCENGPHPYHNHEQIRLAQQQLVSPADGLLAGPDTDVFDGDFRSDGCHLSEKGLDAVAQAWLDSILKQPPPGANNSFGTVKSD